MTPGDITRLAYRLDRVLESGGEIQLRQTIAEASAELRTLAQQGKAGGVAEGWTVDRNEDGEVRVVGPDGGMHPRADRGPQSERLLHALATAIIDAAPPDHSPDAGNMVAAAKAVI